MKENVFKTQFTQSLSVEDKKWWHDNIQKITNNKIQFNDNVNLDFKGVDAFINNVKIQLKLRETLYNDVALEFAHSNKDLGWITKQNQLCEYLFYGFRPSNKIIVFKWSVLQKYWEKENVSLIEHYNIIKAKNCNKWSFNCCVPIKKLKEKNIILKIA